MTMRVVSMGMTQRPNYSVHNRRTQSLQRPKNMREVRITTKVMLEACGVVNSEFICQGQTANAVYCCGGLTSCDLKTLLGLLTVQTRT